MTSRDSIRKHWQDWLIDNNKFAVIEQVYSSLCWGCGQDFDLERAHIVPRVEGGSDAPDNLVMLCYICHKVSELIDPADFLKWLRNRTLDDYLRDVQSKESMRLIGLSVAYRTTQGLQAAKARGVTLGAPVVLDPTIVARIIENRNTGKTFDAIAAELTADGIDTPRGKSWTEASVRLALKRNGGDPRPASRGPRKASV